MMSDVHKSLGDVDAILWWGALNYWHAVLHAVRERGTPRGFIVWRRRTRVEDEPLELEAFRAFDRLVRDLPEVAANVSQSMWLEQVGLHSAPSSLALRIYIHRGGGR